jgi:hypothetical protein
VSKESVSFVLKDARTMEPLKPSSRWVDSAFRASVPHGRPCQIGSKQVLSEKFRKGVELFRSIALTPNQFDAYMHDEPTDSTCRDIGRELGPLGK